MSTMSSRLRIALVEDEPSLVSLYSFALKEIGVVDVATNKTEAEELFQHYLSQKNAPSIILLDLIIPALPATAVDFNDRVGFELLEWLRKQSFFQNVPIVVMTNLDDMADRNRAKQLGAVDYIIKSNVVPKDIVARITSLL